MKSYTKQHAQAGVKTQLPSIECWENQFTRYAVVTVIPEFTSICPKTRLPDFGTITIEYEPKDLCLELKSLKTYMNAYRNLGIFYENAVNKICRDLHHACKPVWIRVTGDFNPRGGMRSSVTKAIGKKRWKRKTGYRAWELPLAHSVPR
ncbi:MAG: preQ(1) synthase [bacterium]